MKRNRCIFYLLIMFYSSILIAQNDQDIFSRLEEKKYYQGEVTIVQDKSIKQMVTEYVDSKKKTIPGFRINIFRDSGTNARQDAENCRAKFISKFGNVSSYLIYDTPFFKIYVGDFRTKSDALKFKEKIKWSFPNAFIIYDQINLPDLE